MTQIPDFDPSKVSPGPWTFLDMRLTKRRMTVTGSNGVICRIYQNSIEQALSQEDWLNAMMISTVPFFSDGTLSAISPENINQLMASSDWNLAVVHHLKEPDAIHITNSSGKVICVIQNKVSNSRLTANDFANAQAIVITRALLENKDSNGPAESDSAEAV